MKTVFLGLKQAFDYFQIGGVESFVRRVAVQMVQEGNEVDYVLYGDKENREISPHPGLRLRCFKSFKDALDAIKGYDHVVAIYLFPKDRLKYALFRKRNCKSAVFHFIYFSWPDSSLKRKLYFSEARLVPYNGKLLCISKRQYDYVSKWAKNSVHIIPPVPESYFLKPEEKPVNDRIEVTFLGRIDPGKGINEVVKIFDALKSNDKFRCSIYGIHLPEQRESVEIHNRLKNQNEITYIEIDRQNYSPSVEDFVGDILKGTDIFIQPYQRLSSTIDTPLLLLEAIASVCTVITKPFGNITDFYGKNRFLIGPENFIHDAIELLKNISVVNLIEERKKIYEKNINLNFTSEAVSRSFLDAICE